jgi:hypothetical protein
VEDIHFWADYNHIIYGVIPADFEKNIGGLWAGKIECLVARGGR